MGTAELSATRVRNKKRRQGRKRRIESRTNNEHGGTMVNGGYTDQKWRAECEEKSIAYRQAKIEEGNRKATNALRKANQTQIGGDHYKNMGVEPWDVVDTWPIEQRIGAYRHGALKYLMRMGSKDENLQEIKKCGHYIEKLIEVLEERDGNEE